MAKLKLSDKKMLEFKAYGRTMLSNTSEVERDQKKLRKELHIIKHPEEKTEEE